MIIFLRELVVSAVRVQVGGGDRVERGAVGRYIETLQLSLCI